MGKDFLGVKESSKVIHSCNIWLHKVEFVRRENMGSLRGCQRTSFKTNESSWR